MVSGLVMTIVGFARVRIRGDRFEKLLNRALELKFTVWDVERKTPGEAQLSLPLRDFFRLRPLLRETGCRVHVLERHGLPFMVDKLASRKVLLGGIAFFILALYVLTSFIWQVSVTGNERISEDDVLKAAKEVGIREFQWKGRIPEPDTLSKQLLAKLPGAAWVGVSVTGTRVEIKVVEATIPDKPPLMNPRHLVAANDAVITEILAERGRPAVKPNQHVRKGDILISGVIGDAENGQTVVAKGLVRGLVWYRYNIEVPLTKTYKAYTGDSSSRFYLTFGNRALKLKGYGKLPFEQYETLAERSVLQWRSFILPIGWLKEDLKAYDNVSQPISAAEAKAQGLAQARADIMQQHGVKPVIKAENILHEKTENGKVYMSVLFEVDEEIAAEQPILP